jgi:hypothetical protein
VLTGDEYGFTHANVDEIEDVIAFARRAGLIPWEAISDGRSSVAQPWVVADATDLAQRMLNSFADAQLDRQAGQRYRVEVWAEAMGWLVRLERICNERGVSVHSGSGSVPVSAIRQAVLRAIRDASDAAAHGRAVTTVLLSIGDLDLHGVRNIARPLAQDVQQFVTDYLGCTAEAAEEIIVVRRVILTAAQVEEHVGERGRVKPTEAALRAGWPYPFTAQAEALPPDVRDELVKEAIDSLHDLRLRDSMKLAEASLHADARAHLARLLDEDLR